MTVRISGWRWFAAWLVVGWVAVGSAADPQPSVDWVSVSDGVENNLSDPLVAGGRVFVGTDEGDLWAFTTDGRALWTHAHGERIYYRPCGDGDRVYFTSDRGLTAVSADTGKEAWALDIPHGGGALAAVPGGVVVGGDDGNVYAVEAKTGALRWKTDILADAPPNPPGFDGARQRVADKKARLSAVATDGKIAVVSVYDQSRVVALDAVTGKKLWSFSTGGYVHGAAAFDADRAYVGSKDKHFYAIDKRTGKQVWKFPTKASIEYGGLVDGDSIYFASCDGGLYAVNRADGTQRWRFEAGRYADGKRTAIYSMPDLHRGAVVFAAGEGHLYAVDPAAGNLRWKVRPSDESELYSSPAVDGDRVFITARRGGKMLDRGENALVAVKVPGP